MTEAIILAGGLGTRLRSVVSELPKCMAPVAGKPFIDHVLNYFIGQGVDRFIFAVGYKSEIITEHIDATYGGLDIAYSVETEPLGTGGAILKACSLIKGNFAIVANGDTIYKASLAPALDTFKSQGSDCMLLLKPMKDFDRYGVVSLNTDGSIGAFKEKQYYAEGLINAGLYLLHTEAFSKESFGEKFSFEKDYLEALYMQRKMFGLVQDAYFIDIGIPADFERAQTELR